MLSRSFHKAAQAAIRDARLIEELQALRERFDAEAHSMRQRLREIERKLDASLTVQSDQIEELGRLVHSSRKEAAALIAAATKEAVAGSTNATREILAAVQSATREM